nr:hypothetical protein [Microbacterium bovistercoris]
MQPGGEHAHPAEDQDEADQLEGGQGQSAAQEHGDRRDQDDAHAEGDAQHQRRVLASPDGDHDQQPEERQHDPGGGAVVQESVHVQRDRAHRRQMKPGRGDEGAEKPRALDAPQVLEGVHVAAQSDGEDHDEQAGGAHRGIEHIAGEIAEGAQLAEVELPPAAVGRGHDRQRGAEREERDDDPRQGGTGHRGAHVERRGVYVAGNGCRRYG